MLNLILKKNSDQWKSPLPIDHSSLLERAFTFQLEYLDFTLRRAVSLVWRLAQSQPPG